MKHKEILKSNEITWFLDKKGGRILGYQNEVDELATYCFWVSNPPSDKKKKKLHKAVCEFAAAMGMIRKVDRFVTR